MKKLFLFLGLSLLFLVPKHGYAMDLEVDPNLLANYIQDLVEKGDKEKLYQLTLQYKDDNNTLMFINSIIEEEKKETAMREEYLAHNLKEQELVQQIKNLGKKSLVIDTYYFKERRDNGMITSQCTWFAAAKAFPYINETVQEKTLSGNARDWIASAKARGHKVSNTPTAGDIIVFKGGGYSKLGHVGYVSEVRDLTIIVEDMNYSRKKYQVTKRIVVRNDPTIDGFITINKK